MDDTLDNLFGAALAVFCIGTIIVTWSAIYLAVVFGLQFIFG
jgi:hypothetical protein